MTIICIFLHFGRITAVTRVPILWTCSAANALSIRLCIEFWSQYYSPFFTFKKDKSLRALFHPWCFFRLSSFASSILLCHLLWSKLYIELCRMYHPLQGPAKTVGILLPNFIEICTKTNNEQWKTKKTEKHAQFELFCIVNQITPQKI